MSACAGATAKRVTAAPHHFVHAHHELAVQHGLFLRIDICSAVMQQCGSFLFCAFMHSGYMHPCT